MPENEETDETIYDKGGREEAKDNDEISPEEEAFTRGYEEAGESEKKEQREEDEEEEKEEEEEEKEEE